MSYRTPLFRPDQATDTTFADLHVGDTLVLPTAWWAPAPGYELAPVTRIQQVLIELAGQPIPRVVLTDTGHLDHHGRPQAGDAVTSDIAHACENAIRSRGHEPVVGLRIWYRDASGFETFALVPPGRTAVTAPAGVAAATQAA